MNIPAGAIAPYPIIIGMNSPIPRSLPRNDFNTRGIASMAFMHNQW